MKVPCFCFVFYFHIFFFFLVGVVIAAFFLVVWSLLINLHGPVVTIFNATSHGDGMWHKVDLISSTPKEAN